MHRIDIRENTNTLSTLKAALFLVTTIIVFSAVCSTWVRSQDEPEVITASYTRADLIDSILATISEEYVIPEIGAEMVDSLRVRFERGDYSELDEMHLFLQRLTSDMREIGQDMHLSFRILEPEDIVKADDEGPTEHDLARWTAGNFGFRRAEILDGNVGYLDLRGFQDTTYSAKTLRATMEFFANCEALIIDLRKNRGGRPEMLQLLASCFLERPGHLYDIQHRGGDSSTAVWSYPNADFHPLHNVELVVLIGARTFSAAESFAFAMKHVKRATLIGEATEGGAHLVTFFDFPEIELRIWMPTDRAVDPSTGESWQSVGVQPDIEVPGVDAMTLGHIQALRAIKDRVDDQALVANLNWLIDGLDAELNAVDLTESQLGAYAGTYGDIAIEIEEGLICVYFRGRLFRHLTPLTTRLFSVTEDPDARVRFVADERTEKLTGLQVLFADGRIINYERTGN